jgi:hypothetical protein
MVAIVRIRPFCRFERFCTHQLLPAYIRKIHYKIIFYSFFFWTFGNNSTGCPIRAAPHCRTPRRSGRTQVRQVCGHFGCIKARIASTTTAEVQAYTRKYTIKLFFTGFNFWTFGNNSTGCPIRCRAVARTKNLDGPGSGGCTDILHVYGYNWVPLLYLADSP